MSGQDKRPADHEAMQQRLDHLHLQQIELEMQNRELRQNLAELDDAQGRYFDLYDLAPVGYFTLNESGLILEANLTATNLLGVAQGALLKLPLNGFIRKEDQDIGHLFRKRLMATGRPQTCELRMAKCDGTTFWGHLAATAAQVEGGAPLLRIVLSDITERKQVELALQESETRYRTMVELSPDATGVHRDGKILYVNPAFVSLFGARSAQELIGKPILDLVHPDVHEIVLARAKSRADGDLGTPIGERYVRLDGTVLDWVPQITSIVFNGKPATLVVAQDVTEREHERRRYELRTGQLSDRLQHSEADLQESEERLALAVDAANLGVWTFDLVRDEVWASDRCRAMYGFVTSQRVDMMGVLQRLRPDDHPIFSQALTDAVQRAGGFETEFCLELPDGQRRWIASFGRVEHNEGGHPILIRGVSLDITARKQVEREVQQKQMEVNHLSRVAMLGELSGALAHELNQPLTSILSNAQTAQRLLAQDSVDLNELRDILQDIVDEDLRASEVIRRLRLLLGKGETQQQNVDVNELILEVFRLLRNDLMNQGVTLQTNLAPCLPVVNADRVQLQQVVINLVLNACDAMGSLAAPDRMITVRTAVAGDEGVHVSVIDQGSGLPAGSLEQVFTPFYTTKAKGMGLGLSICRSIVSANGGRLWGENNPHRGASFHFSIPATA